MFKYLIRIYPLGILYGSAGAFLSPENLVGRSGAKFPPEASTLAGLFFSVNKQTEEYPEQDLWDKLYVAGGFWGKKNDQQTIYVPIPRTYIIANDDYDQWKLKQENEQLNWDREEDENKQDLKSELYWFPLKMWNRKIKTIHRNAKSNPWQYNPILHPKLATNQRCTVEKDGLFLENAVQIDEDFCLIYLSSHPLDNGWYKFGGENHLAEIETIEIKPEWKEFELFKQPINANQGLALLTPAIWGSNRLSQRYPPCWEKPLMLTDKAIPYRYSAGGRLGRGRYAVPAGSVYVLEKEVKPWQEWDENNPNLFPKPSLKHLGCGLALPINIEQI